MCWTPESTMNPGRDDNTATCAGKDADTRAVKDADTRAVKDADTLANKDKEPSPLSELCCEVVEKNKVNTQFLSLV